MLYFFMVIASLEKMFIYLSWGTFSLRSVLAEKKRNWENTCCAWSSFFKLHFYLDLISSRKLKGLKMWFQETYSLWSYLLFRDLDKISDLQRVHKDYTVISALYMKILNFGLSWLRFFFYFSNAWCDFMLVNPFSTDKNQSQLRPKIKIFI
jgi:hypothetical protein